jgi:hypothetical protein
VDFKLHHYPLLAQIDRLANDERRTRENAIRLLLRGIAGADEMKYRAYILELSRTVRCLGEFDSEEKAQTAIDPVPVSEFA